jgi:hypothetical protein
LRDLKRVHRARHKEPRLLGPTRDTSRWALPLALLLSLVVLFVQLSHPALHPLEIIDPGADEHHACPLSHAVAALFIGLTLLHWAKLALGQPCEPLPWLGHSCFIHCLAARPPPT